MKAARLGDWLGDSGEVLWRKHFDSHKSEASNTDESAIQRTRKAGAILYYVAQIEQ